jgi:hypothetical protein
MSAALQCDNGTDPGPCTCEWCMRYGNPDVSANERPYICNGPWYREVAGRCTRCHYLFDGPAYMVLDGAESINGRALGWHVSPVCTTCVTREERDAPHRNSDCPGCGRLLYFPLRRVSRRTSLSGGDQRPLATTCSNACFRRSLRKKRRIKNLTCTVCKEKFASVRKDAKYCSGACRQWAYRLREFAA